MSPTKEKLILLENDLRNFYADPSNKKFLTSEAFEFIRSCRDRQNADYENMIAMYMTEEINYLKNLKDKYNANPNA